MIEDAVLESVQRLLGHTFADPELLRRALTHASSTDSRLDSYERMEFLGDAVLGMVTCELIFGEHDNLLEGEMTKIKSIVVSRDTCAEITGRLGLIEFVVLGKGMLGAGELPTSLAAGVFESVIAALYLDGGFEVACRFIRPLIEPHIRRARRDGHQQNFKSLLQQYAQQEGADTPRYVVLDEKGPDHAKCFKVCVEIGSRQFDSSWGQSKKQGEQQAARQALVDLGVLEESAEGELIVANGEDDSAV